jgi:hypothetical protein
MAAVHSLPTQDKENSTLAPVQAGQDMEKSLMFLASVWEESN